MSKLITLDNLQHYTTVKILGLTGERANLSTSSKANLVEAINEINDKLDSVSSSMTFIGFINKTKQEVEAAPALLTGFVQNTLQREPEKGDLIRTQDFSDFIFDGKNWLFFGQYTPPVYASETIAGVVKLGTQKGQLESLGQGLVQVKGWSDIGDITALSTTDKASLVAAINEISLGLTNLLNQTTQMNTRLTDLSSSVDERIGDLTSLQTTEKSNLVGAINELKSSPAGLDEQAVNALIDSKAVLLTGNQQIEGQKIFSKLNAVDSISFTSLDGSIVNGSISEQQGNMVIDQPNGEVIINSKARYKDSSTFLVDEEYVDIVTSDLVSLSGNQTIIGRKVFTNTTQFEGLTVQKEIVFENPGTSLIKLDTTGVQPSSVVSMLGISTVWQAVASFDDQGAFKQVNINGKTSITDMIDPVTPTDGVNKRYADSLIANAVHLSGDQTIEGTKTFTSGIQLDGDTVSITPENGTKTLTFSKANSSFNLDLKKSSGIKNLLSPVDDGDAANKSYVDEAVQASINPLTNQEILNIFQTVLNRP